MTVLPGFFQRGATRLAALCLGVLIFVVPGSRGQEHSDDSEDGPRKHFLTFQATYRGTATKSSADQFRKSDETIEVNTRFSGRIQVRPEEAPDLDTSPEAQMKRAAEIQAAVMAGDLEKLKQAAPKLLVTWFPVGDQVEITATVSETLTSIASQTEQGESRASSDRRTQSYRGQKVFPGSFGNAFVKIRAEEKKYDIQFMLMPDMAETMEAVTETIVTEHREEGNNRHEQTENKVPLDMGPGQLVLGYSNYQIAAEAKGLSFTGEEKELIGHAQIPVPKPANWPGSWDIVLDVSWQIDVKLPPLELIVTADGYREWRPEGNIKKPNDAGNSLTVRAKLKPKVGGEKLVARVKEIRFELRNTSREPGVCMNWPINAKDHDCDLRLAPVGGGTLKKEKQVLEVSNLRRDKDGNPYADASVESYDFGGRAELHVACVLADGREIVGRFRDQAEELDVVRLPRRERDDWIASSWREKKGVIGVAASDDDESIDGNPYRGDGYTLYEEYRGFAVNGRPVEGEPKKKDLCILNLIGSDAWPGIHLFENATELRVIHRLTRAEMPETRVMNANHRDAPHLAKEQHGVIMRTGKAKQIGSNGAVTIFTQLNREGRPAITKEILMPPADAGYSDFNRPWNLPPDDQAIAYDRAVAHELAHSVGGIHHGVGDFKYIATYLPAGDPRNRLGRASLFVFFNDGPKYMNVRRENPDEDFLVAEGPRLEAELQSVEQGTGVYAGVPQAKRAKIASRMADYVWYVGEKHGECSGDEQCLMRYYFDHLYRSEKDRSTFYLVTPGTEDVGNILCRSSAGHTTNSPNHQPQPRFFEASKDLKCGNCFARICPNDSIPPGPRADGL